MEDLRKKISNNIFYMLIVALCLLTMEQKVYANEFYDIELNTIGITIEEAPVFLQPDLNSGVVTTIPVNTLISVKGITNTGWVCVDLAGMYYIPGVYIGYDVNGIPDSGNQQSTITPVAPAKEYVDSISYNITSLDQVYPYFIDALQKHANYIEFIPDGSVGDITNTVQNVLSNNINNGCFSYACANMNGYNSSWYYGGPFTINAIYYTTIEEEMAMDIILSEQLQKFVGLSDYDKVKGVHDMICNMVTYSYRTANGTSPKEYRGAYNALVDREAVCSGYALLFQRCMDYLNIPCFVHNNYYENHAWNIVCVNGQWYQIDCTWDDQESRIIYDYFLKSYMGRHTYVGHIPLAAKSY